MVQAEIKNNRNPIFDIAKGLGIFFVVAGLCFAFGDKFYKIFHVIFFYICAFNGKARIHCDNSRFIFYGGISC